MRVNKGKTFGLLVALTLTPVSLAQPAQGTADVVFPQAADYLSSNPNGVFLTATSGSAQVKDFYVDMNWSFVSPLTGILLGSNPTATQVNIFGRRVLACPTPSSNSIFSFSIRDRGHN